MNPSRAVADDSTGVWIVLAAAACGLGGVLVYSDRPILLCLALAGTFAYGCFALIAIRQPLVLAAAFLISLEIFPPFYLSAFGETPLYVSFVFVPLLLLTPAVRRQAGAFRLDPVGWGLATFLLGTALSIPFAFWLSGIPAGLNSISRWLLLSHAMPIYYLIRACAGSESRWNELQVFRLLLAGAFLAAAYGIIDFIWPIPLPHPAAEQFIWLEGAILRRAQGPFYESSNFANFCGFFLVASAGAFMARKERFLAMPRMLAVMVISVLSVAVLVAFSRSAWGSLVVGIGVFLLLIPSTRLPRTAAVLAAAVLLPAFFLWIFSPDLWDYLVGSRMGRLLTIIDDPNSATSGRFDTWVRVLSILREQPQYLIFGIGYKTLGITRLFHREIITDNGYLNLLLETGAIGLGGFLLWTKTILKSFLRLARSAHEEAAFWSAVLFSIWCGELVLLLAADAYTYWRNISILAALMALTLNLSEGGERLPSSL